MTRFDEVWSVDGPPALSLQEAQVNHNGRTWTQRRLIASDGHWGVVVIPVRDDAVGLVRVWRPAVDEQRLELPRGFGEDATPQLDARRELAEETALVPVSMREVGEFNLDTGLVPTPIFAFEAVIGDVGADTSRDGEIDELVWVPVADVPKLIRDGSLCDAITLAALACWQA